MLATLTLASSGLAQYREYYARGRVLDAQKKPLPDVEITLLDASTSRRFHMKTDQKGEFKFAGLPHADYEVTFAREGYVTGKDKWEFNAPQDRMQRVEVPDVVLASQAQVQEVQRFEGAKAGVQEAAEKLRTGDLDGAISAPGEGPREEPPGPERPLLPRPGLRRKEDVRGGSGSVDPGHGAEPRVPGRLLRARRLLPGARRPAEGARVLRQEPRARPRQRRRHYNSGLILFETNRVDEALVRFERGLVSRPDDAQPPGDDGPVLHPRREVPGRRREPGEGPGRDDRPREAALFSTS